MKVAFHNQVRRFYEEHRQGLYTYALSISRDSSVAEDAVQGAIFRLLRRGRLPAEPRPYVFRCVRNAVLDSLRARKRGEAPLLDPERANGNGFDPARARLLEQCLGRLSGDERETVILRAIDGLTFREIASVRHRTVSTVASWYRRGLERMRRVLEEAP